MTLERSAEFYQLPMIVIADSGSAFNGFVELYRATGAIRAYLKARIPYVVDDASKPVYDISVDNNYYTEGELFLMFASRMKDNEEAFVRSRWIGGRLYNRLCGPSPDYVFLPGPVLSGAYKYLGEPLPKDFERGFHYYYRADHAERLYGEYEAKAKREGLIE